MSDGGLSNEVGNLNDAYTNGDSAGINQALTNMEAIIDSQMNNPQTSVEETNNGSSTQQPSGN